MAGTNSDEPISRRSVLKRTAGTLAVGGSTLAETGAVTARESAPETARRADDRPERSAWNAAGTHEGVACGDDHPEGSTFTVDPRCEGTDCDVIQLTGLSPACAGGEKTLFADLPGTEPTVWMNPRKGEVPPGTYRVVRAERCEQGAGECDGSDLYRLAFRPAES